VTVGHGAILHACTIGPNCIIGMGAIVLDGAAIPPNSIVAAGSLVPPRKTYPEGSMILGSPAKVARMLSAEEIAGHRRHAADYVAFWKSYLSGGIGIVSGGPRPLARPRRAQSPVSGSALPAG
jgi:carbonic anhydrase/acetyltransferase-like protein (isoleucine patch superfamily)